LIVLVLIGLIIFGPKKLPEMGSSLGKTIREFQKSMREVTNPEPPSSVPPSALHVPQTTTAAPTIAASPTTPLPVAAVTEAPVAPVEVVEERADRHTETSAVAPKEAPAGTFVEADSASLVDSVGSGSLR
jgi:sec-independent protein translocase protein TatA